MELTIGKSILYILLNHLSGVRDNFMVTESPHGFDCIYFLPGETIAGIISVHSFPGADLVYLFATFYGRHPSIVWQGLWGHSLVVCTQTFRRHTLWLFHPPTRAHAAGQGHLFLEERPKQL
jgi:hypothetical protein